MIKYEFQEIGKEIRKDLVKILSHTFNLTEIQSPKRTQYFPCYLFPKVSF